MKKLALILIYIYLFLIILMPKVELFYTLEKFLKEQRVVISDEVSKDRLLFLSVSDSHILYDKIEFATLDNIRAFPLLFVNYLSLNQISISDNFKDIFPNAFESVKLLYTPFYPFKILLFISGGGRGSIDIKNRVINIEFKDDGSLPSSLSKFFKKVEDKLVYEYRY